MLALTCSTQASRVGRMPTPGVCTFLTLGATLRTRAHHGFVSGHGFSRALEFVHLGLEVKYQLTTALARLRERGDREAVGEGLADSGRRKQPLTPGFALPFPPERAVINCGPL